MELAYLHNILDDLRCRFEAKQTKNDFQLQRELNVLGRNEKLLIRKKVLGFSYDVGALKVLKKLKEAGILTFTDYLSSIRDKTIVQGIITDVIDVVEMQDFFVDIVTSSVSSDIMQVHFDECFKAYTSDVIDRPELIKHNLFSSIEKKLPGSSLFQDCIIVKLVNELLTRESHLNVSNLPAMLSTQKEWNGRFKEDKLKLLIRILIELSENHSEVIVKQLFESISKSHQLNWFFLLMMIKYLKKTASVAEEVKTFVKTLFQKFHETNSIDYVYIMMIIGRQFQFYAADSATYKSWLKLTIGEMQYNLNSQAKFKQTLEALQSLIFYETDMEILEIHLQTSISAPRGLNNLVLEYKQQLRVRIASAVTPETCLDLT